MDNGNNIRVRFAPSPSGFLHIGGARSALFNFLFAKKRGGKFIVRIDDTDLSRSSDDSIRSILSDLKWLGLDWDHGIDANTLVDMDDAGPYRASARKDLYNSYANDLVAKGLAYSFTDPADNSVVIKFKTPKTDDITFFDDIRGKITTPKDIIDDFVIIRSNGMATYNFATVIDDHLMGITHVYRADEHLANTPKQILLYKAFNWDIPKFGHMALIFGSDKSKLSKRHGATSIDDFRKKGYTKDALINYIAMLGWGHPKGKDIFSFNDLMDSFSMKKVNPSPAIFDMDKLNYVNSCYLKTLSADDLFTLVKNVLIGADLSFNDDLIKKAIPVFASGWSNGNDMIKDFNKIKNSDLDDDARIFISASTFSKSILDTFMKNDLDVDKTLVDLKDSVPKKDLMWTLRIVLIGTPHGPAVDLLRDLVNKSSVLDRMALLK